MKIVHESSSFNRRSETEDQKDTFETSSNNNIRFVMLLIDVSRLTSYNAAEENNCYSNNTVKSKGSADILSYTVKKLLFLRIER